MSQITIDHAVLEQMVDALEWIANVNATDYEYQRRARATLAAGRAALTTQPHTSPDPQGAYESRCAIDGIQHDKLSFITGYEQGSYDEAMRQWPPVTELTDEQDRALCESHCNEVSDEYFKARTALDFPEMRRIFYAGHRKAWIGRDEVIEAHIKGQA